MLNLQTSRPVLLEWKWSVSCVVEPSWRESKQNCFVLEFSLSCGTGLCFDIKKAAWCFDSFWLWWTKNEEGVGKKESNKERKEELGEFGGCGGEGISGCSMSHQGGLQGEIKRGWGRLEGQAYQCVCGDRGEQAGCLNHNRMEKESKGQDFMEMFNVHRTSCWSSNTAERLGVYRYLMKHPHSHPPPNLLTSTRVQRRRKKKSRARLQI